MYLVFDVGGTFVKYAWMGVDGDIHEKGKYPTPTREGESVPEFQSTKTARFPNSKFCFTH